MNGWSALPCPHDAHRPLRADEDLAEIFTWEETRKATRSLTLHYKGHVGPPANQS